MQECSPVQIFQLQRLADTMACKQGSHSKGIAGLPKPLTKNGQVYFPFGSLPVRCRRIIDHRKPVQLFTTGFFISIRKDDQDVIDKTMFFLPGSWKFR